MAAINRLSIHARVGILAGFSAFAIIALLSIFFISRAQTAEGTAEVTDSITALSAIVRDTDRASDEVLNAARSVSDGTEKLKFDLGKFIDQIRAA